MIDRPQRLIVERQQMARVFHELEAVGRQRLAPPHALEQGQAELVFEAAHLLRDRRLSFVPMLCRAGEGTVALDGHQRAQGLEIQMPDQARQFIFLGFISLTNGMLWNIHWFSIVVLYKLSIS